MKTASIGSVSHGTLRSEDLITSFWHELEYQLGRQDDPADRQALAGVWNTYNTICDGCWDENGNFIESDDDSEIVDELISALDCFSPPYCYFGAHEGDGADFGYWPIWSAIEDFDGLDVEDLSEIPDDYIGEVRHVNDHGNLSIYFADSGNLTALLELV